MNNNKTKKLNKKLLTICILSFLFIIYTILVKLNIFKNIDDAIESFVIGIRNDGLTDFMSTITNLGSAYALIAITILIILVAIIKNKRLPINSMVNLTSVYILSTLVKIIVRRPRPTTTHLVEVTGFSYPSGHTLVSFAFYIFIAISLSERLTNKLSKTILWIAMTTLVFLIAISRIYLGVHHLTDIIGSLLLGTIYLLIFLDIRRKHKLLKENTKWK